MSRSILIQFWLAGASCGARITEGGGLVNIVIPHLNGVVIENKRTSRQAQRRAGNVLGSRTRREGRVSCCCGAKRASVGHRRGHAERD